MTEPLIENVTLPGGLTAVHCRPEEATGKTPVLLCHGRMSGAWQWARLQPFLARRGYENLALNYRGRCGSAPEVDLAAVSVDDFVADARTAAEILGQPFAVGQSTGGLVVQRLAESEAVAAAVLSCSVPPAGIPWHSIPADADRRCRKSNRMPPPVVFPDRAKFDRHVYNRMPEELADAAFALQTPESGRVLTELSDQLVEVDERKVRCPVLSVVGGDDRQVAPETGLAVAAKYGALSVVRPDAGHYALIYEPGWEQTADVVADWLDGVGRT